MSTEYINNYHQGARDEAFESQYDKIHCYECERLRKRNMSFKCPKHQPKTIKIKASDVANFKKLFVKSMSKL